MRSRFLKIKSIANLTGSLLILLSLIILFPLIFTALNWNKETEGVKTLLAFVIPSVISLISGIFLKTKFKMEGMDTTASMLLCAISWISISAIGAIPFCIAIDASYIDAYFEAMSGFTTTGITVLSGLDDLPHSILFWRSLTQWLGGLGILSFFIVVTFGTSGAHHIVGAESHKISAARPTPGMFGTVKILWLIYGGFTLAAILCYKLLGMSLFDAVCHAQTTLSTGGYSPHDASIAWYGQQGFKHYKLIEYAVTFFMMLGGINFLVHFRVLTGDFKALWDNLEVRYWWRIILAFTCIIMIEHMYRHGYLAEIFSKGVSLTFNDLERIFRLTIFQVIGVMTTTGFGTADIGGEFFGTVAMQLFLVMMVIGGCVGSTGGGFKVLRIAILNRLMIRELFKTRTSQKAVTDLVIDKKIVPHDEIHRIGSLFFTWVAFLIIGGMITAICSKHGPWESLSGMFSAVGNIGPCYISVPDMISISPIVKITYIIGMLAGRLEIIPVLLLFSKISWR